MHRRRHNRLTVAMRRGIASNNLRHSGRIAGAFEGILWSPWLHFRRELVDAGEAMLMQMVKLTRGALRSVRKAVMMVFAMRDDLMNYSIAGHIIGQKARSA